MTEPTYRIVSRYEPANGNVGYPWVARAFWVIGGMLHMERWGEDREEAIVGLQGALSAALTPPHEQAFWANEQGRPVQAQPSGPVWG
jgi:hypothetical protein